MTDLVRRELTQTDLLRELEPVVATELDRHLSVAKEWFPHDYVPWSEGRNFAFLGGEDWSPADSKLDEVAKTALVVNLLTEDNLPSYHREIDESLGRDGAWGQWTGRWTAEEGRHAVALRDYLTVTRAVDPVQLERERMVHMSAGFQSAYDLDMLHSVAYVSFQELATRISHRNTGKSTGDPIADQLLARISVDENLHMIFYRNLLAAAIELAPDDAMVAIRDVVLQFQMPGHTIEGFTRRSLQIAMAGIYDLRIHHDDVISPVLRHWKVWDLENLSPEGEKAREELATFLAGLDAQASRFVEKREAKRARDAARSS
ncbi:MAG TPA: acyl-ACP desaturase [Motilibacteraceae bacterium]|nr:acyl-ACP desaturase [Motilibacteraceae bacterium]